jgi:hypothetical protein
VATLSAGGAALGDPVAAQLREQRQKEIAAKSESERARLQRNFKAFRALPQADQERLRQLDRELKEDSSTGGNLRLIMDEYYNWLATLNPGQRQDLHPAADPQHPEKNDPARREIRVRQLLKEQQDQADATGAAKGARIPPRLSSKDLDAVLGIVEQAMRARNLLSQKEIQDLESKRGLARHVAIWTLAFPMRPSGPMGGPPAWWSKEIIESMVEAVSNEKLAAHIKAGQAMDRWLRLVRVVFAGLRAEHEKLKPSQDVLERFFVQLNSEQQDEIMRLPFDQQPQMLTHLYMTKMAETDPENFPRMPQLPFWARPRPGLMRPADEQRGAEAPGARKAGGGAKRNLKKNQKADQE